MLLHVVTETNHGLAYDRDVKVSFETFYDVIFVTMVIKTLLKHTPQNSVLLTLYLPQVPNGTYRFYSNARRFYSSIGNPLGVKGLKVTIKIYFSNSLIIHEEKTKETLKKGLKNLGHQVNLRDILMGT